MSNVEQIQAELRKLTHAELRQVRESLDDIIEDELEFTPEFEQAIRLSKEDLAAGRRARVREPEGSFAANGAEQVTRDAMHLPTEQRLALAGMLLRAAEAARDPEAEAAWESAIRDRMQAIDAGGVRGVPYEDVMREAQTRLDQ